jgi:hypothetical protein
MVAQPRQTDVVGTEIPVFALLLDRARARFPL